MKVLSLFDGISCGRLALEKVGVSIEKYYASEIEKSSIDVTKRNRPDTIHLGDVRGVTAESIGESIDLLIGGSPCTGFSFAGKQLNFNDPQSKLFFEFVRLKEELKPKYFLLENVKMKKEFEDIITNYMGVQPIKINSSFFSAQNRQRLYWTNIPVDSIENSVFYNPTLCVDDILESNVDDKYFFSPEHIILVMEEEVRKRKINKISSRIYEVYGERIEIPIKREYYIKFCNNNKTFVAMTPRRIKLRGENARRFKPLKDKVYTLTTQDIHGILINNTLRTLTPIEWERLQGIPDNWTSGYSDSRRYKMIGNAWTVPVIAHLFKNL